MFTVRRTPHVMISVWDRMCLATFLVPMLVVLSLGLVLWLPVSPLRVTTGPSVQRTHVVKEVEVAVKLIALTFDDGPSPTYTPMVLELLKKYNAHATFFVVGQQVEKFPDVLVRTASAGHQIGNHGYRHMIDYRPLSHDEYVEQITKNEELIERLTGTRPTAFRPPSGAYRDDMVVTADNLGYTFVLWSPWVDPRDWEPRATAQRIASRVLDDARPGLILLLHDQGGNRRAMIGALDIILSKLTTQGYRFVTVDELIAAGRRDVPGFGTASRQGLMPKWGPSMEGPLWTTLLVTAPR